MGEGVGGEGGGEQRDEEGELVGGGWLISWRGWGRGVDVILYLCILPTFIYKHSGFGCQVV